MQKKNYLILLVLGVVSLITFLYPSFFPSAFFGLDDFASKVFYLLNKKALTTDDLVIVSIDDYSLQRINQKWPFRRSLYAKSLNILEEEKAKVVGFDLAFVGEGQPPEDDEEFCQALKSFYGKIVLAYFFDQEANPVYPKKDFQENSWVGFIYAPTDKDGVVRRLRDYIRLKNFSDFSLTIKIASSFYGVSPELGQDAIFLGNKKIPLNSDGTVNLNYLAKPQDFAVIPFYDLISRNFPRDTFKNKIVLFGSTSEIIHDILSTPLGKIPGVFIHANAMVNILKGKFAKSLPQALSLIFFIGVLILIGYIITSFTFWRGFFLSLGVLLLLFWVNIVLRYLGWQLPFGRFAISSLVFLIALSILSYFNFLFLILKIKNRIILDPLTNLFNLKYFYERANLDLKSIHQKKRYLTLVILGGFKFFSKGESFDKLKNIWKEISSSLFAASNFWARYSEEAVVGLARGAIELKKLREDLNTAFLEKGIKVKVKVGGLAIDKDIDIRATLPFLMESLDKAEQEVISFNKDDLRRRAHQKFKEEDLISSLYLGVEEKNIELLAIIEQLKNEERKTKQTYVQVIFSLISALESKDPYTKGHSERVSQYTLMLAAKLNLSKEEEEKIKEAAMLHDLGKIGIPDRILHKKGSLSEEEFSFMKEHATISAKILEPIKEFQEIIPAILHHHESLDGSGYPHGLAAQFIPLGARIIAVADIFDALITGRDYKKAFSVKEAVDELNKIKGKKLDPQLVDVFVQALKEKGFLAVQE